MLGADPAKTKYVAHSGGGEANAAILSGSVDAGVSGLSEFVDQVEAGKMRLLAVSSPVDVEIDGAQAADDQGRGHRPRADELARDRRAAGDLRRASASGSPAGSRGCCETPQWQENVKRYDWTPFVKTGAELDDFVASEQQRVQQVVADLGIGK